MSRGPRLGWLGQALGVAIVTGALLAAIELGAGFFVTEAPPPAPTPEIPGDTVSRTLTWLELNPAPLLRDADLLWRNEPKARKTQPVNPQPFGRDDFWTIENNSEGLRGPERSAAGGADVVRILCIGDSITFGFNVDQPDPYPRQLEALLARRHPAQRFEVVNAGVPGWSWLQGLRFLELDGLAMRPDVVVIGHGTNDQFLPAKVTDEERFHRLGGPLTRAARALALRLTASNSYRLVERAFPPPPFSPDQDSPACKVQIAKTGACHRVSVDEIAAASAEVRRITSAHDVALVLVNLDFTETPAVVGVRRTAERADVPFLDLVGALRERRRHDEDTRAARFGLAPATATDLPPVDPPRTKRAVLRVLAPDRTASYRVHASGYFRPGFTIAEPAYDDGTHGDERSGDGIYSATIEVPAELHRLQYLFHRNDEPELRPLPPLSSSIGDRLVWVRSDVVGPIDEFGRLPYMAERAHPDRDGQRIVAELVADQIAVLPGLAPRLATP